MWKRTADDSARQACEGSIVDGRFVRLALQHCLSLNSQYGVERETHRTGFSVQGGLSEFLVKAG